MTEIPTTAGIIYAYEEILKNAPALIAADSWNLPFIRVYTLDAKRTLHTDFDFQVTLIRRTDQHRAMVFFGDVDTDFISLNYKHQETPTFGGLALASKNSPAFADNILFLPGGFPDFKNDIFEFEIPVRTPSLATAFIELLMLSFHAIVAAKMASPSWKIGQTLPSNFIPPLLKPHTLALAKTTLHA